MSRPPEQAEAFKERERERIPLRRRGNPADVTRWIVSLTDPASDWVTGQVITVDGGFGLASLERHHARIGTMDGSTLRKSAFAMPPSSPAFPPGPYRFVDREYFIIRYRTDLAALRRVVPEPLEVIEPVVNYEFIRMPDSTGFGDYTESGQVIPVRYQGQAGGYTHQMFLNDHPPIAAGRELWGFPKKLAQPSLKVEIDTLVGTLDYGSGRIATGTMGYKHRALDLAAEAAALTAPNFLL